MPCQLCDGTLVLDNGRPCPFHADAVLVYGDEQAVDTLRALVANATATARATQDVLALDPARQHQLEPAGLTTPSTYWTGGTTPQPRRIAWPLEALAVFAVLGAVILLVVRLTS